MSTTASITRYQMFNTRHRLAAVAQLAYDFERKSTAFVFNVSDVKMQQNRFNQLFELLHQYKLDLYMPGYTKTTSVEENLKAIRGEHKFNARIMRHVQSLTLQQKIRQVHMTDLDDDVKKDAIGLIHILAFLDDAT